jgi:ADP-ribose pyrophosphatase YjhB (NUDIX family)
MRRFQTGFQDGNYGLPAGHIEEKETVAGAAIREVKEETAVEIEENDLRVVHVQHRINSEREYMDFFLVADKWSGEPKNMEPEKCDDMLWVPIKDLPTNMVESVRNGIENYQKGIFFSEFGWDGRL